MKNEYFYEIEKKYFEIKDDIDKRLEEYKTITAPSLEQLVHKVNEYIENVESKYTENFSARMVGSPQFNHKEFFYYQTVALVKGYELIIESDEMDYVKRDLRDKTEILKQYKEKIDTLEYNLELISIFMKDLQERIVKLENK